MSAKIHIFLSYRTKSKFDVMIRDELEKQCEARGFKLTYDESGTKEGDSLTTFMEDLASARCVFLLLSPEYFQSAYTLFELVRISEQKDQDNRFIFPVRCTADMCAYVKTTSEDDWKSNIPIRDELCRRLDECDEVAAWQRVSDAWDKIIFPYLDELHKPLEESPVKKMLTKHLDEIEVVLDETVKTKTKELQDKIHAEVIHILKQQSILSQQLALELRLGTGAINEDIAYHMVEKKTGDMLAILARISVKQEKNLTSQREQLNKYLYDVEQICGWLLINSVDHYWFFQHELKLKQSAKKMSHEYTLDYPPYIEVIISRRLLQQACFTLNQHGKPRPFSDSHDVMLFDAFSKDAKDIELLTPIYKDLYTVNPESSKVQELLDDIKLTASTLYDVRNGKPIYYIVSSEYLKQLQSCDWFAETERELAGCLQFFCCDIEAKSYDGSPSYEKQNSLLEYLAIILRLRNKKREQHV